MMFLDHFAVQVFLSLYMANMDKTGCIAFASCILVFNRTCASMTFNLWLIPPQVVMIPFIGSKNLTNIYQSQKWTQIMTNVLRVID